MLIVAIYGIFVHHTDDNEKFTFPPGYPAGRDNTVAVL